MHGPFSQPEETASRWKPITIGAAVIVLLIAAIAWYGRKTGERTVPAAPDPYIANLAISDLKMHAAESFVGATVTYLDGKLINKGDRTVTQAIAEVMFRDALGQVVLRDQRPIHVLVWQGPDRNVVDMRSAPLAPGASADFRLTFEHIPADWNRQYPEVRIVHVTAK
ncbi:MAG TPA: hypothetical protein VGQ71_06925 [Terriglobales bacterium]|nr:hypothetical protein [Terriglobales bacterium]